MAGYNRGKGRLYTANGFFDLATLRAVITEEIGSTNAAASMTDVRDVLLNILDIIDNLEIPEPTPGSGADLYYTAGNGGSSSLNCNVVASGEGVTYAVASGVGTITVPDGVTLKSFTIKGATSILSSNNFGVQIVWETADPVNSDINNSYQCVWDVTNASSLDVAIPSRGVPMLVDKDNVPQKQVTVVAGNTLELFVPSLNAFTHWFIVGVFA